MNQLFGNYGAPVVGILSLMVVVLVVIAIFVVLSFGRTWIQARASPISANSFSNCGTTKPSMTTSEMMATVTRMAG